MSVPLFNPLNIAPLIVDEDACAFYEKETEELNFENSDMESRSPANSAGSISHSSYESPSSMSEESDMGGHTPTYMQLANGHHVNNGYFNQGDHLNGIVNYQPCMNQFVIPHNDQPYLVITEPPQDKFRFRYVSEMHGTHGCILGKNKTRMKKTYPSVKLENFTGDAIIRCTLYSVDTDHRVMHPHNLVAKVGSKEFQEPHDKDVSLTDGYEVEFQNVGIIHTAKKNVCATLVDKKAKRLLDEMGPGAELSKRQKNRILEEAQNDSKSMNLNSVCLCFEALVKNPQGKLNLICDRVYSSPINNMKSALNGELKIFRIDKVAGSCKGDDEVFIFVEKVNKKNIKVRFYELDEDGYEVWEGYAKFGEFDVHKQYGIAFKTPPYKSTRILENVEVYLELKRPSDSAISESVKFTYKPQEFDMYGPQRKRPREDITNNMNNVSSVTSNAFKGPVPAQVENSVNFTTPDNFLPQYDQFPDFINSVTTPSFEMFLSQLEKTGNGEYFTILEQQANLVADATVVRPQRNAEVFVKEEIHVSDGTLDADLPRSNSDHEYSASSAELRIDMLPNLLEALSQATKPKSELKDTDIHYLLKHRMELPDGSNAFHIAAEFNQEFELKKILTFVKKYCQKDEHMKFINAKNKMEQTPLYLSVLRDRIEIVEQLLGLEADIKIETKGKTSVQLAVEHGRKECLDLLLKHMQVEDLNHIYPDGRTLLHEAVNNGYLPIVTALIEAGADPNIPDTRSMSTPLHIAIDKGHMAIAKYLLADDRIDVNMCNSSGNTPLHIACVYNGEDSTELCKILLSADADPFIANGIPALRIKEEENQDEGETILPDASLLRVAELNIKEEAPDEEIVGQTAFDLARDKPDILALLCSASNCHEEESPEMIDIKTEPLSPEIEDALDAVTLIKVAKILQKNDSWEAVAEFMGLKETIPQLKVFFDPAKRLLAGCMGQISTQELRGLLEVLHQTEAVECIDDMIACRVLN